MAKAGKGRAYSKAKGSTHEPTERARRVGRMRNRVLARLLPSNPFGESTRSCQVWCLDGVLFPYIVKIVLRKKCMQVALRHQTVEKTFPVEVLSVPPRQTSAYPEFRYMGSKHRLLSWIHSVLDDLDFEVAADPFVGSGAVSYLMKSMDRRVVSSDFLNFSKTIAGALIENSGREIGPRVLDRLMKRRSRRAKFIEKTFNGVFYTKADLRFLDTVWSNLDDEADKRIRSMALAALIRSCVKRQPRGVFTISGDLSHYDDGRRDLQLSLAEHFCEQIEVLNQAVFSNGRRNRALNVEAFDAPTRGVDLVYLDPPYVPRSDDNCYVKRYHFLEGLSSYWRGHEIDFSTKVRKIPKKFTPFSYRRTAIDAFDTLFRKYREQKIVLSYSSNGFPDLDILVSIMKRYKRSVDVHAKSHRYHFGTHERAQRTNVEEYLIVGT